MIIGGLALLGLAALGAATTSSSNSESGYPFKQAKFYRPGRALGKPTWIIIHTAEDHELPREGLGLQAYAANPSDGREVSWHYAVDDAGIYQSVKEADTAWAAGPANSLGVHIELAGSALQGTGGWADKYSQSEIQNLARLVKDVSLRQQIPIRRIGAEELLAGQPGIAGHEDVSKAAALAKQRNFRVAPWFEGGVWRATNHYDPGPSFPWDELMSLLRA